MRLRTWMALIGIFAIVSAADAEQAYAQDKPADHLMASTLRRACIQVRTNADFRTHALYAYCGLATPTTPAIAASWGDTLRVPLPSPEEVVAVANQLDQASWERLRVGEQQFEQALVTDADQQLFQSALPVGFQTRFLLGFSEFVVDRAQDQIQITLVDRAKNRLCAPHSTTRAFLPDICSALAAGTVITPFGVPRSEELRTAARSDMVSMPERLLTLNLTQQRTLSAEHTDAVLLARYTAHFMAQMLQSDQPFDAAVQLALLNPRPNPSLSFDLATTPAAATMYLASLYFAGLEHNAAIVQANWPSNSTALRGLYATKAMLINAQHNRPYSPPTYRDTRATCIVGTCERLSSFAFTVANTTGKLREVEAAVTSLSDAETSTAIRSRAFKVVATSADAVRTASALSGDMPSFQQTEQALNGIERVALDLAAEDYTSAVHHLIAASDSMGLSSRLPAPAVRAVSFASSIASADDTDAVASAFESFAAPPTSYLRKRRKETGWYATVNAYAGMAGGREGACRRIQGCDANASFAGAYLPLGGEVGRRIGGTAGTFFRSVSLFVQAIDVGTLASWQLDDDESTASDPEIGFKQVFSPGAHIILGIRDLPLAVGVGMSVAPQLRKIEADGQVVTRNAIRPLSVFLAVDVPIFP